MRSKYNTNDIQRQACFPLGDEFSVKCNSKNSIVKVAMGRAKKRVVGAGMPLTLGFMGWNTLDV
ncbi:hypothetical protein RGU72_03350 [Undibacterium sp. 5I1]|uniref:hypothetical protein n=1 Tax=Undibacterium sp. 5I1 TaxID=3048590 RepID=UPI002AB52968|nr:hypothetical protein [Undibacterium sp. 5I1]MDY7537300.1 hypothetical protein [Undibacterium sp. 5I1]MEB0231743.1 hypothetical protein [Undibacterium sp. 10I3]